MDPSSLTPDQLATLAERLLGHVPVTGQTAFLAVSPRGVTNAGVLEVTAAPAPEELVVRLAEDADEVHLVGYGSAGAAQVRSWARALRSADVGLRVGWTQQVTATSWLSDVDGMGAGADRPAPDDLVTTIAPYEVGFASDIVARLMPVVPQERIAAEQEARAVAAADRMTATMPPVAIAAVMEDFLYAWAQERADGDRVDTGEQALFAALCREPALGSVATATAVLDEASRRELVDVARHVGATSPCAAGVTVAAATAVWATSSDGRGPVASAQTAAWLEQVGIDDPRLTAIRVAAARALSPTHTAALATPLASELLDDADRAWHRSRAASTPGREISVVTVATPQTPDDASPGL